MALFAGLEEWESGGATSGGDDSVQAAGGEGRVLEGGASQPAG
jgi:hypothetical protein